MLFKDLTWDGRYEDTSDKKYHFRLAMNNDDLIRTIGWREWIKLPDLGIKWIKAKIDTGARTSSLHANDIEILELDGREIVRFKFRPLHKNRLKIVEASAVVHEFRKVRSSNGQTTTRPVIRTSLEIYSTRYEIDVTLFDRTKMGFRMLIGREALQERFVVDVSKSYCGGKPRKRKSK